eukprot:SAG31_NODE_1426_length_8393_cov_3.363275_2_plen_812_part_00
MGGGRTKTNSTTRSSAAVSGGAECKMAGDADNAISAKNFETNAGGIAGRVTTLTQFRRFLILGAAEGSYYTTASELSDEATGQLLEALLLGGQAAQQLPLDGMQAVCEIEAVSLSGRAAKQGAAITALAYCAKLSPDPAVRRAAYALLPKVCRTGTALFEFVELCEELAPGDTSGWGRQHRRAVGAWYSDAHPRALAQAVTKYRQRGGWSHLDVLRLAHAKPGSDLARKFVFRYVAKGLPAARADMATQRAEGELVDGELVDAGLASEVARYLEAVEQARTSDSAEEVATLVSEHGLVREHIPSALLGSTQVWAALLGVHNGAAKSMPPAAMIRNLNKMTSIGLLDNPEAEATVLRSLDDANRLKLARVHPFSVLLAQKQYGLGHGDKGALEWEPKASVLDGLGKAFMHAFQSAQPTNKRIVQAVDISGSMAWSPVCGSSSLSAREGAAALAWLTAATEPWCQTVGFGKTVEAVDMSGVGTLDQAVGATSALPDGPLDVVLMLDCTGSMGAWIAAAKAKLLAITTQLRDWFTTPGALRVGFVGYRDHNDHMQLEVAPLTVEVQDVQAVVDRQQATGGGDEPEDVAGAFQEALGLDWRADATKLLIHIADAPCHGTKYHGECQMGDSYPEGDPNGLEPSQQVAELALKGIDYCLYDVGGCPGHQGTRVSPMAKVLKRSYDEAIVGDGRPMAIEELGHSADKLEKAVLQTVERCAYGGSDCAAPVMWAIEQKIEADAFVIYTDSEVSPGSVSVKDAISCYRAEMGIPECRVVVVALSANRFTVADPADPLMMDMAGFDASSPQILAAFLEGFL